MFAGAAVFTMEANMKAFINEVKRDLIMKINSLAADVQSVGPTLCWLCLLCLL
jgi:hypothetical protein